VAIRSVNVIGKPFVTTHDLTRKFCPDRDNLEVTRAQHKVAPEELVTDSTANSATAEMLLNGFQCKRRIGVCYVVTYAQARCTLPPDFHGVPRSSGRCGLG
jgi:hypothetical protein